MIHMKKLIPLLTLAFGFGTGYAQEIPNGGFENWLDVKSYDVDQFQSFGTVNRTTDAYDGTYALELKTEYDAQNDEARIGVVTNSASFDEDDLTGFPYDEVPLSMRFWAKYDVALGDAAQVMAIFMLNGNIIGTSSMILEGSTADTFARFSSPIIWGVQTTPDTVVVVMSSHELESDEYNGDATLVIDDLHFATISTRNKDIPNNSFEDWTESSTEVLDGWVTSDVFLEQSGIPAPYRLVSKDPSGVSGSALKLRSFGSNGEYIAGIAMTGEFQEDFDRPAFPVSKSWKYLKGHYKYERGGTDSAYVNVLMFRGGTPIGAGQINLGTNQTDFTYFKVPIFYPFPAVADSALVLLSNANLDNPTSASTVLVLDEVGFTDDAANVEDLYSRNKLIAYPLPVQGVLYFTGLDAVNQSKFTLTSMDGKIVMDGIIKENKLEGLGVLPEGTYVLSIIGKNIIYKQSILKQ
jgi:hypothetical protein